jgi:hypothetical protein
MDLLLQGFAPYAKVIGGNLWRSLNSGRFTRKMWHPKPI